MRELPGGTVTFLFTDIEASTKLLHELGAERYAEELAAHRRVLRGAFERHGGVEVDTQGDAFFIAFATPSQALEAAWEAQEALAIPVRMGIHTGTPLLTDEGYVGADVHRAARIAAAAHGRQVLVSSAAAALLGTDALRDLGEHRLKDLSAPERLYQLGDETFPAPKTLYRTNLPIAANPLIGREEELAKVRSLLADETRVLTVTGPGGTGKTRFALQAAAELADAFADGVFWVPLQAIADSDLVLPAVARAVDAREDLASFLRERQALLVLDNFEHVLDAAPDVAQLVGSCPRLRLLVTSRGALRISGEHDLPLDPLPDTDAGTLFAERARAAGRHVEVDDTVAELCRRLDNLPLALELAAARTTMLDPAALLARLEHALPILTGGRRDAPERQRTLRSTIEWSYELLAEEGKRLFARLSVFAGSFSLESAEAVCDADLDVLASLVDLSLLKAVGEGRFLMLETIREYATDRLEKTGESRDLADRHARHFLELVESAPGAADSPALSANVTDTSAWQEQVDRELGNIRAAREWFRQTGDTERELRLAFVVSWLYLWKRRGGSSRSSSTPNAWSPSGA
jgi:predicted ATPase/class 3 adenylate cyclase